MSLLSAGDLALLNDTVSLLANATLTKIETPGPLANNGDSGTPVTAWTGEARGFLERKDRDVIAAGVQVKVKTDTFILFDREGVEQTVAIGSVLAGSDWEASTVVIEDERLSPSVTRRWSIAGMEHEADGTMDHVLLTLNADAAVA